VKLRVCASIWRNLFFTSKISSTRSGMTGQVDIISARGYANTFQQERERSLGEGPSVVRGASVRHA